MQLPYPPKKIKVCHWHLNKKAPQKWRFLYLFQDNQFRNNYLKYFGMNFTEWG